MSIVTLVSGGLDSTLVSLLAKEEGITQYPLFIDYGQICSDREWTVCLYVHSNLGLPTPEKMNLKGYGELIPSGLTRSEMRINEDAFLPGRNLCELNLVTRFILQSEEQMNQWMTQTVWDEIDIWEGAISFSDEEDHEYEKSVLQEHIVSLKKIVEKHGLKLIKIPRTYQLAKNLGLTKEHSVFYKIYSKYVHPSSILVNKPDNLNLEVIFSILTMNAQIYTLDTLNRISEASGIQIPTIN